MDCHPQDRRQDRAKGASYLERTCTISWESLLCVLSVYLYMSLPCRVLGVSCPYVAQSVVLVCFAAWKQQTYSMLCKASANVGHKEPRSKTASGSTVFSLILRVTLICGAHLKLWRLRTEKFRGSSKRQPAKVKTGKHQCTSNRSNGRTGGALIPSDQRRSVPSICGSKHVEAC